jgi:hypothetical protein
MDFLEEAEEGTSVPTSPQKRGKGWGVRRKDGVNAVLAA